MTGERAPLTQRVLLLGFGDFERHALSSYLRLAGAQALPSQVPLYAQAASLAEADFVIADADHAGAIDTVLAAERAADTVFIGSIAPEGALGWAMRPIDPLQVFREIDAAAALRRPIATAPPAVPEPVAADAPARRVGDVAAAPLALVIDPSTGLHLLQSQLNGLGLRAEAASDSTRALQMLSQQRFDVVLLDVDLGPGSELDGLALCQHLKRSHRPPGSGLAPKVVLVSAHAGATDRVRGTLAGCDAYLAKPFDEAILQRQLRQIGVLPELPSKRSRHSRRERPSTSGPTPLV